MTPLHRFGDLLRNSLLAVPLPLVRTVILTLLAGLCLWVLLLPQEAVARRDASGQRTANLRPWALLALAIQVVIYALF